MYREQRNILMRIIQESPARCKSMPLCQYAPRGLAAPPCVLGYNTSSRIVPASACTWSTGGGSQPLQNPAVPRSVAVAQVLPKPDSPTSLAQSPGWEKQTRKQSATQEDVINGSDRAVFYRALHTWAWG